MPKADPSTMAKPQEVKIANDKVEVLTNEVNALKELFKNVLTELQSLKNKDIENNNVPKKE